MHLNMLRVIEGAAVPPNTNLGPILDMPSSLGLFFPTTFDCFSSHSIFLCLSQASPRSGVFQVRQEDFAFDRMTILVVECYIIEVFPALVALSWQSLIENRYLDISGNMHTKISCITVRFSSPIPNCANTSSSQTPNPSLTLVELT